MRVIVAPGRDDRDKLVAVINAFPRIWEGRVLDVGCRRRLLETLLAGRPVRYVGLDLHPPANVIANLEHGLPFVARAFDIVVALDVLEHIDAIHRAFAELCRVANSRVILTLPNLHDVRTRLRVLAGHVPSGKYGLPVDTPADRHRWLLSFAEARTFVRTLSGPQGFALAAEGCLVGPRRAALARPLVGRLPNLLAPWYLALLERVGGVGG